jgi:hypothetical protein
MTRFAFAAVLTAASVGSTLGQPSAIPIGKSFEVELERDPNTLGAGDYVSKLALPITQGDQYRIEVSPVGGADMALSVKIRLPDQQNSTYDESPRGMSVDWRTKRLPGRVQHLPNALLSC